jgi:uncharacterized coiled-coil DUF342 family protein
VSGDDIVERLREYASVVQRDYYDDGDLPKQAAEVIMDLRAERDASRLIINDLTAEVDRLREQNHELSTRYVELLDTLDATRFERDRLRAAGDALAVRHRKTFGLDGAFDTELRQWEAARRER